MADSNKCLTADDVISVLSMLPPDTEVWVDTGEAGVFPVNSSAMMSATEEPADTVLVLLGLRSYSANDTDVENLAKKLKKGHDPYKGWEHKGGETVN